MKNLNDLVPILKSISNQQRILILELLDKNNSSYSNMLSELRINNSNKLQNALKILLKFNLIKKNSKEYSITDLGRNMRNVISSFQLGLNDLHQKEDNVPIPSRIGLEINKLKTENMRLKRDVSTYQNWVKDYENEIPLREPDRSILERLNNIIDVDINNHSDYSLHERSLFRFSYRQFNGRIIELTLVECDLGSIPEDIFSLKYLRHLNLGVNGLTDISDKIENLRNLEFLGLAGNKFDMIPKGIEALRNLTTLTFGQEGDYEEVNRIKILPAWIGNLEHLVDLDISYNPITMLPENIKLLKNLKSLDLYETNLTHVSPFLLNLNLEFLYLDGRFDNDSIVSLLLNKGVEVTSI